MSYHHSPCSRSREFSFFPWLYPLPTDAEALSSVELTHDIIPDTHLCRSQQNQHEMKNQPAVNHTLKALMWICQLFKNEFQFQVFVKQVADKYQMKYAFCLESMRGERSSFALDFDHVALAHGLWNLTKNKDETLQYSQWVFQSKSSFPWCWMDTDKNNIFRNFTIDFLSNFIPYGFERKVKPQEQ